MRLTINHKGNAMFDLNRRKSLAGMLSMSMLPTLAATSGQAQSKGQAGSTSKTLRFDRPATQWLEALPVGNGRVGAMMFGGAVRERLQLNHIELWAGRTVEDNPDTTRGALSEVRRLLFAGDRAAADRLAQDRMMAPMNKRDYGAYQTLGDLSLVMLHDEAISDYSRELDMASAEARVRYSLKGHTYSRTLIASHPDKALFLRLETTAPEGMSLDIELSRQKDAVTERRDKTVVLSGQPQPYGVHFCAQLECEADGGRVTPTAKGFQIRKAKSVLLRLAAATDLIHADPNAQCDKVLTALRGKTWTQARADHRKDYRSLFDVADLTLDTQEPPRLASERLALAADPARNAALVESYFHFGRYLLIASNRPGSLPPNLQGLWCDSFAPPWECDYHININLQMNFWPVEVWGLSSLHESLFDYAERLKPFGEKTAQIAYGAKGAVAHYTSNPWGHTALDGKIQWGLWPEGLAWLSLHFWEHYLYTGDEAFLRDRALPFLKSCAEFTLDYLVEDPRTGRLVSGPAASPENAYLLADGKQGFTDMGCAMAQSMAYSVLSHTSEAARIAKTESELRARCEATLARLQRLNIGPDGRLLEWSESLPEAEPGHRHLSHLFALHPSSEIDPLTTPELAAAARKSLDYRLAHGGGHTGWSAAWLIMFHARLNDGEGAAAMLQKLFLNSTAPNLFDTHPMKNGAVFQIDGNLGATAAVGEMLLQSHNARLRLLPALPAQWKIGKVRGLKARGGLTVDMAWKAGRVTALTIVSSRTVTLPVHFPAGQAVEGLRVDRSIHPLGEAFRFEAGKTYTL